MAIDPGGSPELFSLPQPGGIAIRRVYWFVR